MAITPSELRRNVYRLLDEVLETGVPLEIERRGRKLRIVPERSGSKLDRIKGNPNYIIGDDNIDDIDWLQYWEPDV